MTHSQPSLLRKCLWSDFHDYELPRNKIGDHMKGANLQIQ